MCFLVPWPQRKKVSSGTYQFLIYPGHISFPFMNWQLEDHTFREVIFDTRLCPTACRHGKTPKGVHVLYPCTIHIKAALPHISKLTLHDCQLGDFICWRRDQRKYALEPYEERFYQILERTDTEGKLQGIKPRVCISQLRRNLNFFTPGSLFQ